ncbi:hypothetical protein CHISP_3134 [Chitinispirillum alkaliphilum]|nr:hypothetical protein CHISP_3134 [Chitinispirillum alkaliphilum]
MLKDSVSVAGFIKEVKPIRMKEPLAELLGAFEAFGCDEFEYRFEDLIKVAGHVCPTVSMAYLLCRYGLRELYNDKVPVRGDVSVLMPGKPDEGVLGVIGQVLSFITGASMDTGFKGISGHHKRKNLLRYSGKSEKGIQRFIFKRLSAEKQIEIIVFPHLLPTLSQSQEMRIVELLEKNVWDGASSDEVLEFRKLWLQKVKNIIMEDKNINRWLIIN